MVLSFRTTKTAPTECSAVSAAAVLRVAIRERLRRYSRDATATNPAGAKRKWGLAAVSDSAASAAVIVMVCRRYSGSRSESFRIVCLKERMSYGLTSVSAIAMKITGRGSSRKIGTPGMKRLAAVTVSAGTASAAEVPATPSAAKTMKTAETRRRSMGRNRVNERTAKLYRLVSRMFCAERCRTVLTSQKSCTQAL